MCLFMEAFPSNSSGQFFSWGLSPTQSTPTSERDSSMPGCAGADVQSGRGGLRDVREPQDTGPEVRERRKKAKGPCFLVGWEGQGKGTITQETAQGGLGWRKGEGGLHVYYPASATSPPGFCNLLCSFVLQSDLGD